jgi:hypothetical protein
VLVFDVFSFLSLFFSLLYFFRSRSSLPVSSPQHVTLSKPSNRQLLQNAVTYVCLAGATMVDLRTRVLNELQTSPGEHFLLLLKLERALTFSALYLCNIDTQQAMKLQGEGPDILDSSMIQNYYKYDSAAKQFKILTTEVSHNL